MDQGIENYTELQKLIDRVSRVIGLRICYHDRLNSTRLPLEYRRNLHPACGKARKSIPVTRRCVEFDLNEVHNALRNYPEGRIHTCPYGLTEIVVPVFIDTEFAEVLFAGPCWTGEKPSFCLEVGK